MQPTAIVLSIALWPDTGLSYSALYEAAAAASRCVVWRTTTEYGKGNKQALDLSSTHDRAARTAFRQGLILESANVTAHLPRNGLWWDPGKIHFTASSGAYRLLNLAMLDFLHSQCPL